MQRLARAARIFRTVVLTCLLSSVALPARAAPTVWVAPSLVKVRPTDAAGTVTQTTLSAAIGETESFQIIVQAPSTDALTNVNVTAPDLGGPTSTLYREHYLYLTRGSADWSSNRNRPLGAGYWPDGLVPFLDPNTGLPITGGTIGGAPFSVAAGQNQPVWVDVYVPRTTAPGTYTGAYTVTSDQGEAAVSLTLRVWHFSLPVQPALRSCFLYWPTVNGGEGRGVLQADQELLRNRLNPFSTAPASERSLIDTEGLASSALSFWSNDFTTMVMTPPPTVEAILADKAKHQPDLYLYCYTADEISDPTYYPGIKAWAQALHAAGVDQLVTTPPVPDLYDDGMGTGRSAVDVWVVRPMTYVKYLSNVLAVQAKGDRVWSYNAAQPDDYSPKWLIDYAPINFRVQPGFISNSLSLVGLFYWRVDWWSSDVWNGTQSWASYPGEGVLVYPGDPIGLPGQVAPSVRLKYLRDGVDDFDYLQLLKAQGEGAWAQEVATAIGPDWSNWIRSPEVLEAARLQLANRLENLATGQAMTVSASASPSTLASGGSTILTASASSSTGAEISAWSWSDGGAGGSFSSPTGQNPVYTAAANNTGASRVITLTLTVTAGVAQDSKDVSLVELASPSSIHSLTVNAYAAPATVEPGKGTSLTVVATDSKGHTGFRYAWSDNGAGGTFSPSATVASPAYTPPANTGATAITRTLTATVTCVWVVPSISASANVTVTSAPPHALMVTAWASPTALASDGSTVLSAVATDNKGHTGLTYAWSDNGAGGAFSPSAAVASPTYTPPANTSAVAVTRTLTVTVTCTASSPSITASGSVTVTSAAAHTLAVTASASPTVLAADGATALNVTVTDNEGHSDFTYAWSDNGAGGAFSPSPEVASPTYTPPVNTTSVTVTRTLSVTATCAADGHAVSATGSVTVTSAATHALAVAASATPTTIAADGTTALSTAVTDNEEHTGFVYAWSDGGAGGAFSPSAAVADPAYTPPTNTSDVPVARTLTVTVTCAADSSPLSASASVTVTSAPAHALTVVASASPATIASGASTVLSAIATDSQGHPGLTYAWSDGGAGGTFSPSAAVANPTYTPPVNTSGVSVTRALTVTVTCSADGSPLSASGSVTVTSAPPHALTVTVAASPTTLASGASTVLGATVTDNEGHSGFTYAWSDGGVGGTFSPSAAAANPTYTPPVHVSGVSVTRTLTATVTCSADGSPLSASGSVTVTCAAAHAITVVVSASATTLASGGSTKLTTKVTDSLAGHSGFSHAWSDGGAGGTFSPSASAASPTYTAPGNASGAPVTRTLTVTVTCKWTQPWVSTSASVTVTESTSTHTLTVTASANPTTVASGGSTKLTAVATDNRGHTGIAYAWNDNGAGGSFSPSATSAKPTYTPPANTTGATITRKLIVIATCKWTQPWISATASVNVLEKTK
jgi:hypothetical protein